MQGSFTRIFPARSQNFLGFIKNFPACTPAACKKFKQSRLGWKHVISFLKLFENLLFKPKDRINSNIFGEFCQHGNLLANIFPVVCSQISAQPSFLKKSKLFDKINRFCIKPVNAEILYLYQRLSKTFPEFLFFVRKRKKKNFSQILRSGRRTSSFAFIRRRTFAYYLDRAGYGTIFVVKHSLTNGQAMTNQW